VERAPYEVRVDDYETSLKALARHAVRRGDLTGTLADVREAIVRHAASLGGAETIGFHLGISARTVYRDLDTRREPPERHLPARRILKFIDGERKKGASFDMIRAFTDRKLSIEVKRANVKLAALLELWVQLEIVAFRDGRYYPGAPPCASSSSPSSP
jgi:hypothetical protein